MKPLPLSANGRVLVIALRRLGDVLLTTPLIHSIKRAFPASEIDVLVFAGTEGILAGNPDVADVITLSPRPRMRETLLLASRLARRYDLALSTQTGDRPTALALLAGRRSIGLTERSGLAAAVKRMALSRSIAADENRHRVLETLRLAEPLGIAPLARVLGPRGELAPDVVPKRDYAVLHAAPMYAYKRWHAAGWLRLAEALSSRGLGVVVTGSGADRAYLDSVWKGSDITRCDGKLSWPELSALIGAARVYIGPDTAVTHLAAATGSPTVALYGPTDPQLWGPWPAGGLDRPWLATGTVQQRGNVWLVQNPLSCLPCQQEGCERHTGSYSRCLDELDAAAVVAAVDQALAVRRGA